MSNMRKIKKPCGRGEETPDDDSGGIRAFNAQRAEDAAEDGPPLFPWVDKIEPEIETETLKHLATVIIPADHTRPEASTITDQPGGTL